MVLLVLVPSVVALLLWFAASGYLVFQGFYNRAVAVSVRQVSIPAVAALSSIQEERRLSVAYLARPSNDLNALLDQRRQADARLTELRFVADSALANAPQSIHTGWATLAGQLDRLPTIRSEIDAKSAGTQRAYAFYNDLLDSATRLFDTQARVVPDVAATQGGLAATDLFQASDLMSRSASMMDGAFASGALNEAAYLEYVRLVGAYHFELTSVSAHLEPVVRAKFEAIQDSDVWRQVLATEDAIIANGPWRTGQPGSVSVGQDRWSALTGALSDALVDLTITEADLVAARTLRTGNNQLLTASLGSLLALTVAIAAILWAVRQSRVLVDRALSVRLARLGTDADAMVDQRLPAILERLRRREPVDLTTEFATENYGTDEIGQVASVINRSLQAATGAAVNEAKARAAGTAMLMGVARRPQRPLQRGLKVIEELQNQVGDEKLLTQLFDIHHQLNQTRRFLENLVILAGGQIGRRFQNPVPLRRVLLASFAEARNYQRITLRGTSDVSVVGHAVAEVIHLMAELLDNALAFSPPGTTVWVTSSQVNHGVAVEIEDAGVGMSAEAVERANVLLATAPTPDVTELRDGAQIELLQPVNPPPEPPGRSVRGGRARQAGGHRGDPPQVGVRRPDDHRAPPRARSGQRGGRGRTRPSRRCPTGGRGTRPAAAGGPSRRFPARHGGHRRPGGEPVGRGGIGCRCPPGSATRHRRRQVEQPSAEQQLRQFRIPRIVNPYPGSRHGDARSAHRCPAAPAAPAATATPGARTARGRHARHPGCRVLAPAAAGPPPC